MLAAVTIVTACGTSRPSGSPIFVDGRAVAAAGDTVLALTRQGSSDIVLRERSTGAVFTRGDQALHSPHHIQEHNGQWYVSDVTADGSWIVTFSSQWDVVRRLRVDTIATAPHQFAILPDGRIVLEAPGGRLVTLSQDSLTTFAVVEQSARTGFLVAALGGVLHAIPDQAITLYNANGNIRWRLPWQWEGTAYMTDLAVDALGRIHVLAGEAGLSQFYAYTLDRITGEVLRWSVPGTSATFVVSRMGEIEPDSAARWGSD